MIFQTENSTYEVDLNERRIRRLYGRFSPTDRQGGNGEWKSYTDITDPVVGCPVRIIWRYDTQGTIARITETSLVTKMEEV